MVYLFLKMWYPSHKAEEVSALGDKVMKENPPNPEVSELVVFAGNTSKEGYNSIAISKIKEGKMPQAMERAYKIVQNYAGIEGYEYSVEIWLDVLELPQD